MENQQFIIKKSFTYRRKEKPPSPQILNNQIQIESPDQNGKSNKFPIDEIKEFPPQKKEFRNSDNPQSKYPNPINQIQYFIQAPEMAKKLPYLFQPFLLSFILNLGLGIVIFATQGDEAAIIVFEVFMVILNIFSGYYYYTKSTEDIVTKAKCFLILFGTMIAEFLCLCIQLLISWITKVSFWPQLVNIISLAIFLLYFYYQRKEYQKNGYQNITK